MPEIVLPAVEIKIRDHLSIDTFDTLIFLSGLRFALGPSESAFSGYLIFSLISRLHPYCNPTNLPSPGKKKG